jgi:hypothetical protein
MTSQPKDDEGGIWQQLDAVLEISLAGDNQPCQDYIFRNASNETWRQGALEHLINTCGEICDGITTEKIFVIMFLCNASRAEEADRMLAFFETKWTEFCDLKQSLLNEEQRSIALAAGHGLLGLLAHLHTEKAIKYLEEIVAVCRANKNEFFGSIAADYLTHARTLASLSGG